MQRQQAERISTDRTMDLPIHVTQIQIVDDLDVRLDRLFMAETTPPASCPKPVARSLQTLHATGNTALNLGLFRDFQRIIDFDAQIPDGTLQPIACRQ